MIVQVVVDKMIPEPFGRFVGRVVDSPRSEPVGFDVLPRYACHLAKLYLHGEHPVADVPTWAIKSPTTT